jgi:tetratricopeptide (TPR) repeat protein
MLRGNNKPGFVIGTLAGSVGLLCVMAVVGAAQAPSSIQMFMPEGGLPDRSLRFTLTRDDGRVETLFTDTKGKFLITGDLVRDAEFVVEVETDGRTFGTTVVRFRLFRNMLVYVPVFLSPLSEKKGQPTGVLDVTEAKVPEGARLAYQRAMQEATKGDAEQAISDLRRAISLYPRYPRALNDLGVLYLKLNRLDEAAATFRQANKIDEHFLYPRLNLGITLNRQGKHSEALPLLAKLYQENSQLMGAAVPYSEALAETGNFGEADKVLRHALDDKSLNKSVLAEAHFRLGAVLNRQGQFPDAVVELQKAIDLEPNAVMAHLQLGGALIQLKRLAEAERELLKAYELGGSSAGAAQFLLGQVYYLQLNYESALHAFEQYLRDVPNAPNAAQVKDAIEKIKGALKPG